MYTCFPLPLFWGGGKVKTLTAECTGKKKCEGNKLIKCSKKAG